MNDLAAAGKPNHAPIAADGAYGPNTVGATERFQRWAGITADGVVGPNTSAAATDALSGGSGGSGSGSDNVVSGPLLRTGNSGPAVRAWQSTMNDLAAAGKPKHAPIAVDGVYGPNTVGATERFQRWAKIDIDGVVGPRTRAAAMNVPCVPLGAVGGGL